MKGLYPRYDVPMTFTWKKSLSALLAGLLVSASVTVAVSALESHGTGAKIQRAGLTNNPNYTFSEAYKTSVWYENFTSLELGANQRNNMLRIAVSQLGYHEGDSNADLHGRNTEGTGNFIEYRRLLTPDWHNNSGEWCACFVNWCLNQAHIDTAGSEIGCQRWIDDVLKPQSMWQSATAYGGTYKPQPADFIFFDWDMTGKWSDHIGLVLYTTDTRVYTIEGNSNDCVALRSYPLSDARILGYGTPAYHEGDEPTMDFSYAQGMPAGIYVINSADAALTDGAGGNPTKSLPLGASVTLVEVIDGYALVTYGEHTGYLPANMLSLMTQEVILTYHPNGGDNAPTAHTGLQAETITLTNDPPTRAGDTFLGWSTVPYNVKVDYHPGDTVTLTHDMILYAVWEKHAHVLAADALAEGLLPEYPRPQSIQHSGALLMNGLKDTSFLTADEHTSLEWVTDKAADVVLSVSTEATEETETAVGSVSLDYRALCESLKLLPMTRDTTAYAILKIKDVGARSPSLALSFNGGAPTEAIAAEAHTEWQYVVFDLSQGKLDGDMTSLRVEITAAEGTLLISDIYLASSDAVKNAVLDGKYVYPVQSTYDTETEEVTTKSPETPNPGDSTTSSEGASEDTAGEGDTSTDKAPAHTGCQAWIRTSAWISAVLCLCIPALLKGRKE